MVRNRLRRRLRALLRDHVEVLVAGADYLISSGRDAVSTDHRTLESDFLTAVTRANREVK